MCVFVLTYLNKELCGFVMEVIATILDGILPIVLIYIYTLYTLGGGASFYLANTTKLSFV